MSDHEALDAAGGCEPGRAVRVQRAAPRAAAAAAAADSYMLDELDREHDAAAALAYIQTHVSSAPVISALYDVRDVMVAHARSKEETLGALAGTLSAMHTVCGAEYAARMRVHVEDWYDARVRLCELVGDCARAVGPTFTESPERLAQACTAAHALSVNWGQFVFGAHVHATSAVRSARGDATAALPAVYEWYSLWGSAAHARCDAERTPEMYSSTAGAFEWFMASMLEAVLQLRAGEQAVWTGIHNAEDVHAGAAGTGAVAQYGFLCSGAARGEPRAAARAHDAAWRTRALNAYRAAVRALVDNAMVALGVWTARTRAHDMGELPPEVCPHYVEALVAIARARACAVAPRSALTTRKACQHGMLASAACSALLHDALSAVRTHTRKRGAPARVACAGAVARAIGTEHALRRANSMVHMWILLGARALPSADIALAKSAARLAQRYARDARCAFVEAECASICNITSGMCGEGALRARSRRADVRAMSSIITTVFGDAPMRGAARYVASVVGAAPPQSPAGVGAGGRAALVDLRARASGGLGGAAPL